jgi:hypothetical protein
MKSYHLMGYYHLRAGIDLSHHGSTSVGVSEWPLQPTNIIIATRREFISIDYNLYHNDLVTILPHGSSVQKI